MSAQSRSDAGDDATTSHATPDPATTNEPDAGSLHQRAMAVVDEFRRRNHDLYERLRRT